MRNPLPKQPTTRDRADRYASAPRWHRAWRALRREDGVTLMVSLGLMLVASALIGGAFIANNAEVRLSHSQTQARKAYYAAQAGISWYLFHLAQNGAYLTYCTEPPGLTKSSNPELNKDPLNQFYKAATGREELKSSEMYKVQVPGATEEEYAIQLVPEQSAPSSDEQCDPNKIFETMIEKSGHWKGTFRIRSTGFSGNEKRSIVATFKNEGFLDFVYYTTYEEVDPGTYPNPWSTHTATEAESSCANVFTLRQNWCVNIYFGSGDEVKGPMHTEDHVGVIGSPSFGREVSDAIEFGTSATDGCGSPDTGYSEESAGSGCGTPTFKGTHVPVKEVKSIQPPPSDKELVKWAENGGLLLKGYQEVILEETQITVKTPGTSSAGEVKAWPTDGVLYVDNNGACSSTETYKTYHTYYPGSSSCGNVFVRGKYKRSLTIGAANNVIIDGNLVTVPNTSGAPEGNAELGLIAENFVRIYHPVAQWDGACSGSCSFGAPTGTVGNSTEHKWEWKNEATGCSAPSITGSGTAENPNPLPGTEATMTAPIIDAGILALNHSFSVDNVQCPEAGAYIGTLSVHGAIAQKYRGIVAQSGGPGYLKSYEYDNRLQAGEPPHFLNPVQAPWKIERETLAKPPK
jgi:hypothetical protein